jgi:hypothetical protein
VLLVLKSPRFLYLGLGDPELDDYGVAERLSFGLWDSLPDQQLWEAASQGKLHTPAEVESQARRMLANPRTKAKLRDFLHKWLDVERGYDAGKDKEQFPEFNELVKSDLLTSLELFPGNIQGGSHTPAGWASGISIDQEIKNFLQSRPESRTRFGSLEFGVWVGDRADPWTRMVYAGPNKPIAPIDDPYQMLAKLYGRLQDQELVSSILDDVQDDLRKVKALVSTEDQRLLEEH